MYCVMCGTQNPDYAKFCLKCGNEMVKEKQEESKPNQVAECQIDNAEEMPLILNNEKNLDLEKCSVCGSSANGVLWDGECLQCVSSPDANNKQTIARICPNCGNAFSGKSDTCPYCQTKPSEGNASIWICPECYEENSTANHRCVACGYILTEQDNPPVNIEKETWVCEHCHTKNLKYDNVCSHCGSKKGGNGTKENRYHSGPGCYRHPERQPVAQCPSCGAYMCQQCYDRYEGHLCKNCTYENNQAYISRIRTSLIFAAIFFVLGWIIGGSIVGSGGFLIGLWAAGLPGGFAFNWFDAYATWEMGCLGTVFYWIFRLLVASVAGLILTIINIFRLVHAISVQHDLEEYDIWD